MDLFHRIDDAQCVVRQKGGVFKQLELYRRRDRIYVKHGGGFVRICARFGETWGTSSPSITVLEMPVGFSGLLTSPRDNSEPRWSGAE